MNHTINYLVEIRETLVKAEPIETKGHKQYGVHEKSNPILKDWHNGEKTTLESLSFLIFPSGQNST